MTVSSEDKRSPNYVCNGSTVEFSIPFYILDKSHIKVYLYNTTTLTQTLLTITTHYTVTVTGLPTGNLITTVSTYDTPYEIIILRAVPLTQTKDYVDHDDFPADSHEGGLDKLTMKVQEHDEILDRCLKFLESVEDSDVTVPTLVGNAGLAMVVNTTEDGMEFNVAASANHNDLVNFDGGTVGEYYHLTSTQWTELINWLDNIILASNGDLTLVNGTNINEFSTDGTMAGNSDDAVPTEQAVVEYVPKENILINQDFSIWQENTTFTNPAHNVYTADGFVIWRGAGGGTLPTVNVKKNTANVEVGHVQCCELEITNVGATGATRYWAIHQAIEDFENYRGKTVTVSFRVKSSVAMALPGGILFIWDGVAGSTTTSSSITTSWVTYSATITVDDAASLLKVYFYIVGGVAGEIDTTGSIYIQWMKMEVNSVATALIPRKTGDELRKCQRYYQKSYAQTIFPGATNSNGIEVFYSTGHTSSLYAVRLNVRLPVVMKAAPTVTLYDLVGNSGKVTMAAGNNITGTTSLITDGSFRVYGDNGAVSTTRHLNFHYTAVSRVT